MNKFGLQLCVCALVCAISSTSASPASGSSRFGGFDRNGPAITQHILKEIKPVAVNLLSRTFLQRWRNSGGPGSAIPRDPILPELPDPLPIDGQFDLRELGLEFLSGDVSLRGGHMVGLSTVADDFSMHLTETPANFTFEATATQLATFGDYTADIQLEIDETLINAVGSGCLSAELLKPDVNIIANLLVNLISNRMSITSLTIDLGFESLIVRADEFEVDGTLIDWEWFDENSKPVFDSAWVVLKPEVEADVKDSLNEVLKDCKVSELIGGDYLCLQPVPPPFLSSTFQGFNLQPSGMKSMTFACSPITMPSTTPAATDGPTNEPEPTDPTNEPVTVTTESTDGPTNEPVTTESTDGPTNEPVTTEPTDGPTNEPVTTESTDGPTNEPATTESTDGPTNEPVTTELTGGPEPTNEPEPTEPSGGPEPTEGPTDPPTTAGALANGFRNMNIAILAAALFKIIFTF